MMSETKSTTYVRHMIQFWHYAVI